MKSKPYISVRKAAATYGVPRDLLMGAIRRGELHRNERSGFRLYSSELTKWMRQWAV